MTELHEAILGIARTMRESPAMAPHLSTALLVLAEALVECRSEEPPPLDRLSRELLLKQFAGLECLLGDRDSGQRRAAICRRLEISRSSYYRLKTEAIEAGLLLR